MTSGFMKKAARHALIVGVLVLAFSTAVSQTAAAPPPAAPDPDPFYTAPADLGGHTNGDPLAWRSVSLFGLSSRLPLNSWQIQYLTTDSEGKPVTTIATVVEPSAPWRGPGSRPLLAYASAEDSLTTACAPSATLRGPLNLSSQTTLDLPFLLGPLMFGWALVIPDYEGPQSRFLDGVMSGRALLDGIRAARRFPSTGLANSPTGVWGYSGGAFAALWAGQLHAQYAPELPLTGIAAGGIPADIPAIANAADGGPKAALALLITAALIRNEPRANIEGLLNKRSTAMLADVTKRCGTGLLSTYAGTHVRDYSVAADLFAHPTILAAAHRQELGSITPDVPLYLYHSNADEMIPSAGVHALINRYCSIGSTLTQRFSSIPGHTGAATVEALGALRYLGDRFAGPPTPGCAATS
ncbi:lipase family protein [Nocardia tengchongensis]|uniref:lipase family protein n=1 Tax=Nocardia tengchongensis TaxID=2055889 RepID=UPI0036770449